MLLNEIIKEVGMIKRAVKYYEEKGLLSVDKDSNGYRNYSMQDVKTLKKISVYRKLGIGIKDIQTLLEKDDKSILLRIYQEKLQEKILQDSELEALKQFIDDGNADKANDRAAGHLPRATAPSSHGIEAPPNHIHGRAYRRCHLHQRRARLLRRHGADRQ